MIPEGDIKRIQGESDTDRYRLRVGKHRIIYGMLDDLILIIKMDTRGDIYK